MKPLLAFIVASAFALLVLEETGCTPKQQAQAAKTAVDVAACVLEHEGEAPEAVAAACAGTTVEDVLKIFASQRKAMAAKHCVASDAGVRVSVSDAGPAAVVVEAGK